MNHQPQPLPLLIYDGDCTFCRLWIAYWRQLTGDRVDYRPFQQAANDFPDIPRQSFEQSVQLILPDGQILSAARAVFRVLAEPPNWGWLLWLYEHVPLFAPVSEGVYRLIADHRDAAYRATALLLGTRLEPASYRLARWLFLRAMGLIYFFAFASLIPQMAGLYGSHGLLPVVDFLSYVGSAHGPDAPPNLPSVFWLNSSDGFLIAVPVIGAILSILLTIGVAQRVILIALYGLYLSILNVGQDFMAFQWDILLLEAGFLAIFLAPGSWRPHFPSHEAEPPRLFVWLVRWLLFRLIFGSGMVKLLSGDPTWSGLTALSYHYYTQPLPTPLAWYANTLPVGFQKVSTAMVFVVELGCPWLIVLPRRVRLLGGFGIVGLQCLIALTGNYTFFNLLTMAMCLLLFDDQALRRIVLRRFAGQLATHWERFTRPAWKQIVLGVTGSTILFASTVVFLAQVWDVPPLPRPVVEGVVWMQRYGIVNTYGLFAEMTTERPEIIIEGSDDGIHWRPYEFRYKPGDVQRPPPIIAPFQPRLDWQMWFAALGTYRQNGWFVTLMQRLLEGSPEVLGLLDKNPFPDHPPRSIRATLYRYEFSTPAERATSGAWWKRIVVGEYFPEISTVP